MCDDGISSAKRTHIFRPLFPPPWCPCGIFNCARSFALLRRIMRVAILLLVLAPAAAFVPGVQTRGRHVCQATMSNPSAVLRVAEAPAMFGGGGAAKAKPKKVVKKAVKKAVPKKIVKKVVKKVIKKVVAKRVVKKVVPVKKAVPKRAPVAKRAAVPTRTATPSDNFFVRFFQPKSLVSNQPKKSAAVKKATDDRKKARASLA